MKESFIQVLQKNSFLLALLLHLLFLISAVSVWHFQIQIKQDQPDLYVPSYIADSEALPGSVVPASPVQLKKEKPVSKEGIEKSSATTSLRTPSASQLKKVKFSQDAETIKTTDDEPVHMVGDKKIDKPLMKLLGQALAKHLIYPKSAVDFNIRGVALIGFNLDTAGNITNVQLVKSSGAGVLDEEAVSAVRAMSPVKNVNLYLTAPDFLVVGIIFG